MNRGEIVKNQALNSFSDPRKTNQKMPDTYVNDQLIFDTANESFSLNQDTVRTKNSGGGGCCCCCSCCCCCCCCGSGSADAELAV